jgi:hypothetical protein
MRAAARALFVVVCLVGMRPDMPSAQEPVAGTDPAPAPAPAPAPDPAPKPPPVTYSVDVDAAIVPTERAARVSIHIRQGAEHVQRLRFRIDPSRHSDFKGDGEVELAEGFVYWHPPAQGGSLHYRFGIDHLRNERSYDARCTSTWAIFRGDDLVPPSRTEATPGAESRTRLRLRLPNRWAAATPYPQTAQGYYRIDHPMRLFDRPTGWFVVGRIGIVTERIGETHVTIAGPAGQKQRRGDLLAMLQWTLPTLHQLLGPGALPRLLVIGAGDPMWRGGLSGPASLFLHADRPLIVEDGTSPLLHELVHAALRIRAGSDGDWIVEGLAELYSLELLRRSGTISENRYEQILERIARRRGGALARPNISAATVAHAATVLRSLDREIRAATEDERSLDDVVVELRGSRKSVTTESFRKVVEAVAGRSFEGFFRRHVTR